MTFGSEELRTIYKSVRYYQMNKTVVDSKEYQECDAILTKLFGTIYDVPVQQPSTNSQKSFGDPV
jgi:hypothetical protein